MEITFDADSVSVDSSYHVSGVSVTVEVNGRHVAEKLDLDDRLYEIELSDIVSEIGADELLQEIGEEDVRMWLLANSDPDDTLQCIDVGAINDFIGRGASDSDSPV